MLKRFGENIWICEGADVLSMGFRYPTRMAIVRLRGDALFVWSPVGLTSELKAEIDALGRVAHIVAPNSLHHVHLAEWIAAVPDALVHAPPGLRGKRKDIAFNRDLSEEPSHEWAGEIDQVVVRGNAITTEVVFYHRTSATVLFTDLIQQFPDDWFSGWRRFIAKWDLMISPAPTVPRKFRLAFTDRRAARDSIAKVLSWPAQRVLMAHGSPVEADGHAHIARAFGWLID